MSAITVTPPFPVFSDITGAPLQSGFVYVGAAGLNAEANPIPVFWDSELSIPALQPLRTINGYISRNGSPAQVYADAVDYSLLVKSKTNALIWSTLKASGISSDSSGVSYTPSGAGAETTTVQEKLRTILNAKDKGAKSTNTTAQNKTALQLAITEAGITGGVVYVDYDCDYGFKLRTPSTWPSFTGITKPVLVIDYSQGDTQLPNVWPTAYDGMQARHWFHTPQTTSPGQHDGNYQWARADWNPGYVASNDSDLTGARTSFDSRRCGFALAVNGSIGWQLLQGSRTGATLTDEELSNLTITKFAIAGDTLGDYTPYLVERKTGFTSYGGGRNLPSAYHHFEPVLEGTAADIALFESSSTTTGVRLRNVNGATSGGTAGAQDVLVKNVAGSVVLSTEEGDGLKVDRTSRRVTLTKALQQAKVNLSYSPSITPNSDAGNIQQVFCNNGTAFAINTPSGTASAGQKLTIRVSNISGGSLGTLTWGTGYKLASWTQPANGFSRSITFFYDDSTPAWVEIGRTSADIPN